ncbi:hypothetical protein SAMN05660464_3915 [Geodermatophilus dictyosporus]|uniref:Uncharacterized protein n=1 Tax=Geodermatophilus dictyosporus TaxID=1523247 RepID=A0A1I5SCX9_9ACTN|nr:hypothetical protein SAMN05660464_3915 [Geodermatophilus dictyosporus]
MRGQPPPTTEPVSPAHRVEAAYRDLGTAVLGYALRRAACTKPTA